MKIEILETFLDGKERYEKGDTRTVSEENGAYFCAMGWASDVDGKVATGARQQNGEARLDIRGSQHSVTGEV